MCAFNDGYEFHSEIVINTDGSQETIETAAFKMDLVFASHKEFNPSSRFLTGRRRLECNTEGLQECCSADSINDSMSQDEKKKIKKYCKSIGCPVNECPNKKKGKKKKNKNKQSILLNETLRFLIEKDLLGTDFNDALNDYTDLKPVVSGAVLDATGLEELALCRANNYNIEENDEPIITCEEYEESDCEINDYLIVEGNETESFSPTFSPTTLSPTMAPTIAQFSEASNRILLTSSPSYPPPTPPTPPPNPEPTASPTIAASKSSKVSTY